MQDYKLKLLNALAMLCVVCSPAFGAAPVAEVVWVNQVSVEGKAELQNQILYSRFSDDSWSTPGVAVYQSEKALVTPFIATQRDGSKLLLWSEARGASGFALMTMTGTMVDDKLHWSSVDRFTDMRAYNLGAIAVVDVQGRTWVIWVSEGQEDSDIFASVREEGEWSTAQMVNSENDVPDLNPMAVIDPEGELNITWSSFSYDQNNYVELSQRFKPEVSSSEALLKLKNKLVTHVDQAASEVPVPEFLPINSQLIRLHMPSNSLQQFANISRRFDGQLR